MSDRNPKIYCIMVTNKNRKRFLPTALVNFAEQTYPNKTLLIINHSPDEKLILEPLENVHEFQVNKEQEHFTLGKLRNIALEFVPDNALWMTNDDDDYKNPDYIALFIKRLLFHNLDILFMKNRLEVNLNNGFIFRSQFRNGRAFFIAKKIREFKYLDLDTIEDKNVRDQYNKANKATAMYDNDPKLYVRAIHNTNTSIFVNNQKSSIVNYTKDNEYQEFEATQEEIDYVNEILGKYYKN